MRLFVVIICVCLPLIVGAGLITNISSHITGDPLEPTIHWHTHTNYNSWGVMVTNNYTNSPKWRDDKQRERFNALHPNMFMKTNGIIIKSK